MAESKHSHVAIFYALAANVGIAIGKGLVAFFTGSTAMLAEAIHSSADCLNQLLLLWGIRSASRPPDAEHPLGYGRAVYFWSFIVAVMLFSMGGLASVYEGVHKLSSTEPITRPWIAIGVLVFSVILEGFSLAGAMRESRQARAGKTLWQWFRETRQSELLVVAGEDIAALCGLAFALAAIVLSVLTQNPIFDAIGSILIGVLLMLVAVGVGSEIKELLIGQSATPQTQAAIRALLEEREEVQHILNLMTVQLGADVVVAVKAYMKPQPTTSELVAAINRCEVAIRDHFPNVRWIFFEPDEHD
jgi:cation diffusion facilitator family transporter